MSDVVRFMFSGSALGADLRSIGVDDPVELEVDLHVWVKIKKTEQSSGGLCEFNARFVGSMGMHYDDLRLRAYPLKPGEPSPFKKIKKPCHRR